MAFSCRTPRRAELSDCALTWYSAVDDYMARLGRPLPSPHLDPLLALMNHLLSTDPERFLVAVKPAPAGSPPNRPDLVVGFGIAARREHVWFLSQLYVLPNEQRQGIGRALLTRLLPGDEPDRPILATCTDSVQPASSGLYSRFGIVPRVPVFNLVGSVREPSRLPPLPAGIAAVPIDALPAEEANAAIEAIDRAVLGYAHQADHTYLRLSGRTGFIYFSSNREPAGYGYSSEVGRFGPVAVLDDTLTAPVIGHLSASIRPRGATTVWVPGDNDRAIMTFLEAGLRIEGFPAMLSWTRPFAALDRYIPASLALL